MMLNINKLQELINASRFESIQSFADELGVSRQTVYNIIATGKTKWDRMLKICELLACDPDQILEEKHLDVYYEQIQSDVQPGIGRRFEEIRDYLHMSYQEISQQIRIPKSTIYSVATRDSCNLSFVVAMAKRYPWINLRWFILGEGQMNVNSDVNMVAEKASDYTEKVKKQKSQ